LNKKKKFGISFIIILVLFVVSISFRDTPTPVEEQVTESQSIETVTESQSIEKGSRLLGVDITHVPNVDYATSLTEAEGIGIDFITLSISWDDLEPEPNQYNDSFLELVNSFYSSRDIELIFIITPIDGDHNRAASDLKNKSFDDEEVISRFNKMMDYVYDKTPNLKLAGIGIGNEIAVYLDSPEDWQSYEKFYKQVGEHINSKDRWKEVPIGTKVQFSGIVTKYPEEIKSINRYSDVFMVTYYPLESDLTFRDPTTVESDMQLVIQQAAGKPIYFLEMGYSSGTLVNSSLEKQKQFILEVFKAWDKHADNVKAINFTWMHDISESKLTEYVDYYDLEDSTFRDYLGTLGLKYYDGQPKSSWITLKEESSVRGWIANDDS
jgi:hypothetical protein